MRAGDDIEIVKEVSDIGSGGQVRGRLLLAVKLRFAWRRLGLARCAHTRSPGGKIAVDDTARAVLQCVMTEGAFAQLVPLLDTFQPR